MTSDDLLIILKLRGVGPEVVAAVTNLIARVDSAERGEHKLMKRNDVLETVCAKAHNWISGFAGEAGVRTVPLVRQALDALTDFDLRMPDWDLEAIRKARP